MKETHAGGSAVEPQFLWLRAVETPGFWPSTTNLVETLWFLRFNHNFSVQPQICELRFWGSTAEPNDYIYLYLVTLHARDLEHVLPDLQLVFQHLSLYLQYQAIQFVIVQRHCDIGYYGEKYFSLTKVWQNPDI